MKTYMLSLVILALTSVDAHAGRMIFGYDDKLTNIEKIGDTNYFLSYRTSTYYFIAGVYMKDCGYVIRKSENSDEYKTIDEETLLDLEKNAYPDGLPKYSISIWRYLWGYLLWVAIFAVCVGPFIWTKLIDFINSKLHGP